MNVIEPDMAELEAIWAEVALLPPATQKVAQLIKDGRSEIVEIATALGIRPDTVKYHLTMIYDRTRARNLLQMAIAMNWQALLESAEPVDPPKTFLVEILSPREFEVAHLVARGFGNQNIAPQLGISRKTLKRHMSNILTKLGFSNRIEVALRVLRENFFFYQYQHSSMA